VLELAEASVHQQALVCRLGDRPSEPVVIQGPHCFVSGGTMTGKTVTRADLGAAVYEEAKLSRSESSALVELVLKEITDTLAKGETVKLSSFGSFMVRKKGQRIGRNPKTGTEAAIPPRRVMVFKPSAILKQQINAKRSVTKKPVAELGSSAEGE
jgi:integration host factor subunit alpha